MANSWGAFNPNNLGGKTLDSLRNDIYAGFRTKTATIQGRQGKYGRGPSSTKQVFNAGYYKNHTGWRGIGDKLGININSQNDVRQLFDYVNNYRPAAPRAAAPKAPARSKRSKPKNLPTTSKPVTFDTSAYDAQIAKLGKSLAGLQNTLKQNQDSYAKSLADQQSNFNTLFGNQQKSFDQSMAAQTEKYDKNMSSLRNSLNETMSNKALPSVGVKTSGYSQQAAALTRQGMKGTFGRTGLRIKGIKDNSLNI
jgi:hypothetical protein